MNIFGQYIEAVHLFIVGYMIAVPVAALFLVFLHGFCTVLWNEIRGRANGKS